jgi:alpha-L-fucosidase 2
MNARQCLNLVATAALYAGWGTGVMDRAWAEGADTAAVNPVSSEGFQHAVRHAAIFNWPAEHVPSKRMADGPLLGNGDLGIALGGLPDEQFFHIGKNDFWSVPVGALRLRIPALQDATYRQEQDLAQAEVRGEFTRGKVQVKTRSWVAASENLLVTEITSAGEAPVTVAVDQVAGEPLPMDDKPEWATDSAVMIGRESSEKEPRHFAGIIDDVRIHDRMLTEEEICAVMAGQGPRRGLVMSWPENHPVKTQVIAAQSVAGKVGQAVQFDGLASYVNWGTLRCAVNAVTVSAWVNPASFAPGGNCIVAKDLSCSLGLRDGYINLTVLAAGRAHVVQTTEPLALHAWHHLAAVYDGFGMAIYVNGAKAQITEAADSRLNESVASRKADSAAALCSFIHKAPAWQPERKVKAVATVTRVVAKGIRGGDKNSLVFDLQPGQTARILTATLSDGDDPDYAKAAKRRIETLEEKDLLALQTGHREWWAQFWSKSFLEIPDKLIEQYWYGALYVVASCSREGKVAPGLLGLWKTGMGRNAIALNYNFEAPYFIAYASNHPELTHPFYQTIYEILPKGREMARASGWKGVHLPTQIGPWGILAEEWRDYGQRSNAALVAMNFIWHYQYTQDTEWLKKTGYPYLSEVAAFWEDYLKFEPFDGAQGRDGRYVIYHDSPHETGVSQEQLKESGKSPARRPQDFSDNFNGVFSLGLVRTLFTSMLAFSEDLGVDADRRVKWQHIVDHLSKFPTQERNGKTVFRYTERGMDWFKTHVTGIWAVFPAGAIGLESDPKLIEISKNTINELGRWSDINGFATFYTSAARVGYDPGELLRRLRSEIQTSGQPNLTMRYVGGGIENNGAFLVLNEMLFQSHEGVLRFFPCWPKEQDARFGDLRAYGAFLVSAELKDGMVRGVRIRSEKGRDCTVQNPWPGSKVQIVRDGNPSETVSGERLRFKTRAEEVCELVSAK